MTVDISTLVPDFPTPFRSADLTFWCIDLDLDAFLQVDGAEKVTFQRESEGPNLLATARYTAWGDPIQNVVVYVTLSIEQARTAVEHFGRKSYVHEDDDLRRELAISESVTA